MNNIQDKDIMNASKLALNVFQSIEKNYNDQNEDKFMKAWKQTLLKIDEYAEKKFKSYGINEAKNFPKDGQNILDHSKVVDLKNGILFIEADHPGWIEIIKMHENFIVRGLNFYVKEMGISSLAMKVSGNGIHASQREKEFLKKESENKFFSQSEKAAVHYEEYMKKLEEEKRKNKEKSENIKNSGNVNARGTEEKIGKTKLPPHLAKIFSEMEKKTID